jgi:hypothetical protein
MEYTIRFAFKRDGEVIAPPRMTYAIRDAQAALRDIYREAIDALCSAARRCISAPGWPERSSAARSPSASSTSAPPIRTAGKSAGSAHCREFREVLRSFPRKRESSIPETQKLGLRFRGDERIVSCVIRYAHRSLRLPTA